MPLLPLPELRAALPRDARLIGIDPGRRTIGLALSDVLLMLATPYRAIPRGKLAANAAEIRAIAESQNLVLAVGTPGDDAEPYLIHNRKREDCRITAAPARAAAGTLVVDPLTAKRLRLSAGASVRAVPLSAQKRG